MQRTAIHPFLFAMAWVCTATPGYAARPSLYFQPGAAVMQPGDRGLTCAQLDREIAELEPLTYSYKPGFYEDPAHAAAIWGSTLAAPAAGYLIYSGVEEYFDDKRMFLAHKRIEVLRRLKAYRRCYE